MSLLCPLSCVLLLLLLSPLLCAAHAGPHRHAAHRSSNETCASAMPPSIWSFHLHLLFEGSNANQTAQALQIRSDFIARFRPNGTCSTLYHGDEGLCMFEPNFKPWGPFVTAEWAIFIPIDRYMEVVPYMMQHRFSSGMINAACVAGDDTCVGVHRPDFSILVHPNSGCEYQDHNRWPLWGGRPWEINNDAMDTETPFDVLPPSDKPFP